MGVCRGMGRNSKSYQAWLSYELCKDHVLLESYRLLCGEVTVVGEFSERLGAARDELIRGLSSILGQPVDTGSSLSSSSSSAAGGIVLGVLGQLDEYLSAYREQLHSDEGYILHSVKGSQRLIIAGKTDRGALYGVFHLLRLLQEGKPLDQLSVVENPYNGLRMMNQWDNMDGSIERGYAGRSIFYKNEEFKGDLVRVRDYARLLASTGINAISINNVNVHKQESELITEKLLPKVAEVASMFRKYGISTFLSINFASPMQVGGLSTADPLDESVRAWWAEKTEAIYKLIPDFGGFLVKADSEFRPGPFTYGRDHADGANMLAEALASHGGLVIWRCFVYNCLQDWRDRRTDRARAAYDHFMPLDGRFHERVILQIKNGPMDFQVREPVSPLIGALERTNQLLELQITQEYTGQQKHLCYLVPQWKEAIDFDTHALGEGTTVAKLVSGAARGRELGGFAAVSNIGDDENWTGHVLAQANLYGYGRLAWNPLLDAETIAREWIAMTFGTDEVVMRTVLSMLMSSWPIYESYTSPLGIGWMVQPNHHYGPSVDGYEYSKWGTYHFADLHGMGVDRTQATGTGYSGQYHAPNAEMYNSLEKCPDELLLFFHHVPYTHVLHSGKTVIQHIYDTHFEGAEQAEGLVQAWQALEGRIDEARFKHVLERLLGQAEHAKEWRDVINTYFYRKSGIPDAQGRTIY
jgi:alpha-glucuronidase